MPRRSRHSRRFALPLPQIDDGLARSGYGQLPHSVREWRMHLSSAQHISRHLCPRRLLLGVALVAPAHSTASADALQSMPGPYELSMTDVDHVVGGSQSTGAGAGKVTFNPFSITHKD